MRKLFMAVAVVSLLCVGVMAQALVSGNSIDDGWTSGGNSLSQGVYVRGDANYSFGTYSSRFTGLAINDNDNPWLASDTILGVGGKFVDITAGQAGWSAFTGYGANAILSSATKLQAKFGALDCTFAPSTTAPASGNGLGSLGTNGGNGAVQIRTSAYFKPADWAAGSGTLQLLNKPDHIERNGDATPNADVARLIWVYDANAGRVDSWQILLNASLLDRLNPTLAGMIGNKALLTVQNSDGKYTDALVSIPSASPAVPEPMSIMLGIMGLGSIAGFRRFRK